jgi:hypothetical protein
LRCLNIEPVNSAHSIETLQKRVAGGAAENLGITFSG